MIRRATEADVPRIVEMAAHFFALSEYREMMTGSPAHIAAFTQRLLEREDATIFVAETDRVIGMLAIYVFEHPFSGERVASELVWWVEPETRGAGVRLLTTAKKWAKEQGATVLQMIAPNDHVGKFYRTAGYRPVETVYQGRIA